MIVRFREFEERRNRNYEVDIQVKKHGGNTVALVLSVFEQGMIYAIMALGIYITYTILDFPDLTVDGSFPLGAALSAVLITKGVNPLLTLVIAFAAGAVAGTLTGLIHRSCVCCAFTFRFCTVGFGTYSCRSSL